MNAIMMEAARELAKAVDRITDENLPGKLAGIVKLHAGIAVGSAFIPIPGADVVAFGANIWTMYVRINKELELPFSENVIKSVAAGVVTNLGSSAVALVAGSVLKFIPGIGSFGGAAIGAAIIYALTVTSGIVYMNVVAKLLNAKNASQISEADLKSATEEFLKNKSAIKEIMSEAKKDYKETQKAA